MKFVTPYKVSSKYLYYRTSDIYIYIYWNKNRSVVNKFYSEIKASYFQINLCTVIRTCVCYFCRNRVPKQQFLLRLMLSVCSGKKVKFSHIYLRYIFMDFSCNITFGN